MVRGTRTSGLLLVCVVAAGGIVTGQENAAGPPANLKAGAFQALVERMWRESPTFRTQCEQLARERQLTVIIRGESKPSSTGVRADTAIHLSRTGKVVRADIVLMSPSETIELIAHEIEHVIEHVEGVRLHTQGCLGSTSKRDSYESCRAVEIGRKVAREVEESRKTPPARNGRR